MTTEELLKTIRAEIERLKGQLIRGACAAQIEMETNCKDEAYNEVLSFIDSLPEEQPSNDLEEAAEKYARLDEDGFWQDGGKYKGFFAGAKWQTEQMMKNAVESEAEELYNDGEIHCTVGVGTYFKPGDVVYVIKKEDEQ